MDTKSAVIMSRNDGYGGNLELRALHCLNSMTDVFDEVFYIDFNSSTRSLIEEIRGDLIKTGKLHHIIITPEQAEKFWKGDSEAQPCTEVFGRNIGISRAKSDWIVSTNIDIVTPEYVDFSTLDKDTFYACSRLQFMDTGTFNRNIVIPEFGAGRTSDTFNNKFHETSYNFLSKIPKNDVNALRESFTNFDESVYTHMFRKEPRNDISMVDCCGDFQIAHKDVWNTIRGFEESMIYRGATDTNVQLKAQGHGYKLSLITDLDVIHLGHTAYAPQGGGKDNLKRNSGFGPNKTNNPDNWGFSDLDLEMEII
tara:strand:+ start:4459 stop:5388 length:930 start_codon:yes stop_codon:yes gene_type:complete